MATAERIRLRPLSPFDFGQTLWFLDRNLDDCMHTVKGAEVLKAVSTPAGNALLSISEHKGELEVRVVKGKCDHGAALQFVEEWFDLNRDLEPFYRLLRRDSDLRFMARRYHGFKIVGIPDLFECLVWCIAGQQINLTFAYTLKRRLVERYGTSITYGRERHLLFPAPEELAQVPVAELRELQFTTRKAEYIKGIAQAVSEGTLSKSRLQQCESERQMLDLLLQFRGVGRWTANYALMKSLRAMNRVPYGDAGLKQALGRLKGLSVFTDHEIDRVLSPFEGWRTYLVFYLWRSLREMA